MQWSTVCELKSVFQVLADRRRRIALCCLTEHETLSLPDLAEYIAEEETGADLPDLSEEYVRDVYFALYHTHIPQLENAELARYEQERDLVVSTARTGTALGRAHDALDSMVDS